MIFQNLSVAVSAAIAGTVLRSFCHQSPHSVRFVQVGGNDGLTEDPIHEFVIAYGWQGIIAEPLPQFASQLGDAYRAQPQVQLAQVACSERGGEKTFYFVDGGGDLGQLISSFSLSTILRHADRIPHLRDITREIQVPVMTVSELAAQRGLDDIDIVVIDTEGHDHLVVKGIDFRQHHPALVMIEHKHLVFEEMRMLDAYLSTHGYDCLRLTSDTIYFQAQHPVAKTCEPLVPIALALEQARPQLG